MLVPVTDPLTDDVIEAVPENEGELEGLAPIDKDVVGVLETDKDSDMVELGVIEDVAVPLKVADEVGVLVAVGELVILAELELLAGVFEGLEPILIDADDDNDIDEVSVTVDEAVWDDVAVPEIVALEVGVPDGVFKALVVDDGDNVGD